MHALFQHVRRYLRPFPLPHRAALLVIAGMLREEMLDEAAHAAWRAEMCAPEARRIAAAMAARAR